MPQDRSKHRSNDDTGKPEPLRNPHQPAVEMDSKMLELLVCPLTKSSLHFDVNSQELISDKAKLAYPVRDGVPILLASEARPLEDQ